MEMTPYLSPLIALLGAPLLLGCINRVKAVFAGRKGLPLLQHYFIIYKLLRKGAVYSTTTSWTFKAGPMVTFAAMVAASCLLPFGNLGAPLSFTGDLLLFVYLFALGRFMMVVAALDTGSAFEGMGASREVYFAAIAEPVLILALFTVSKTSGVLSLVSVTGNSQAMAVIPALLTGSGLFLVLLAENSRIPVDDPNTHLELTMIHEVMVLDHSGPDFAFVNYTAALKLWLFSLLVTRVVLPVRPHDPVLDFCMTLAGMVVIGIAVGIVESIMARLRLVRVPQLLAVAFALVVTALFLTSGVIR